MPDATCLFSDLDQALLLPGPGCHWYHGRFPLDTPKVLPALNVLRPMRFLMGGSPCSPISQVGKLLRSVFSKGDPVKLGTRRATLWRPTEDGPSVFFRNLIQKLATKANDLFPPKFFFPSFLFLTQTICSLLYTAWLLTLRSLLVHGVLGEISRNQPGTPLPGIPGVPALPTS